MIYNISFIYTQNHTIDHLFICMIEILKSKVVDYLAKGGRDRSQGLALVWIEFKIVSSKLG